VRRGGDRQMGTTNCPELDLQNRERRAMWARREPRKELQKRCRRARPQTFSRSSLDRGFVVDPSACVVARRSIASPRQRSRPERVAAAKPSERGEKRLRRADQKRGENLTADGPTPARTSGSPRHGGLATIATAGPG